MKHNTTERYFGVEPLEGKAGMERVYAELLSKYLRPADFEQIRNPDEFRIPSLELVRKVGKRSKRSNGDQLNRRFRKIGVFRHPCSM